MIVMLKALSGLLLAYLGLCALLFVFQRSMIYFPHPGSPLPPGTRGLAIDAGGLRVKLTQRPREGAGEAVVYFGGNAEDVHGSLPELAAAFPDAVLYLVHYRGYGGSEGSPGEAALVADALRVIDEVAARHPGARLTLVGRSLGSGVAVQAAAARPQAVTRLVLVTPFDSLLAVGARHYPFLPVRLLLRDRYASDSHADRVQVPVTLIAAQDDEIIPVESAQILARRFLKAPVQLHVLQGVGHNTIQAHADFVRRLRALP